MAQRVFLDIQIGDRAAYEKHLQAYNRAVDFWKKNGQSYGWAASNFDSLEEEDKQNLAEIYKSDKNNKGEIELAAPKSLSVGQIIVELCGDCPKTTANFKALCTGEKGKSKFKKEKNLHYKGCCLHRIIPDFVAQGGDFILGDGSGGESIYGGTFNDEKAGLARAFEKGTVGMANSGKNTNTSQFFFTLSNEAGKKLNGKHVAFGKVVSGLEILDLINVVGTAAGTPTQTVTISDCGLAN